MTNPLARFIESDQAEEIVANLNERGLIDYAHRAELYHALIEIAESILKIYGTILPELEAHLADDPEDIRDILFELGISSGISNLTSSMRN